MSNPKTIHCLDTESLGRFLREQLTETEEARVQEHIGTCEDCQAALESLAGNPALWSGLREYLSGQAISETDSNDAGTDLEDLTRLLGPTDDPHMLGRLGSYEVCGLIGRGSTGLVVKALEPRLGRYVAIKILSPAYQSIGSSRRRFEREGRAIAAVSHEHVVPIYAVDDHRGLPFIVMKYIPGLSLEERIHRDGPLDTCVVTRVGLQVARGLAAAHAQGIVHRDVKPANVILESTVDRAMVTDFGLAQVADEATMTRSGTITGTPQYMSPEQARGDAVDVRCDLFSLGSMMYAACTGRPPFRAETVFGVIHRVCNAQPRPIREINPEIAEWLASFIDRLMAKAPTDRFQTAAEVTDALSLELAHLQNPTGVQQPPRAWLRAPEAVPAVAVGGRRSKGQRTGLALVLAGALLLACFVGWRLGGSGSSGNSDGLQMAGLGAPASRQTPVTPMVQDEEASVQWTQVDPSPQARFAGAFEQEWSQSLPAEAGGVLTLRVDRGDVVIAPGDSPRLNVTVLRRVASDNQQDAAEFVDRHQVRLLTAGSGFTFNVSPAEALGGRADFENILYRIEMPHGYKSDLFTGDGSISVGDGAGDVKAIADGGDVRLGRVLGTVWARSREGDIDMSSGCDGHADLLAVRGHVQLANASTSARVGTSSGNITLGESTGEVTAQTSGGSIVVDGIAGPIQAFSSGGDVDVRLRQDPTHWSVFSAAGGDVNIGLAEDVAVTIEARGELATSLPYELENSEGGWGKPLPVIRLNGGGARLEVMSTTGELEIAYLDENVTSDGSGSNHDGSGSGSGSGSGGAVTQHEDLPPSIREKTSGAPRPGALVTVALPNPVGNLDGYTLYLPVSHGERETAFPVLLYLQGSYGTGGEIADLNNWGLARLLRDESDLTIERNRLLLDEFIVVSLHIQGGQYFEQLSQVEDVLDDVLVRYGGDPTRVYVTGLSRGGHGSWGLAAGLPDRFAAVVPAGGRPDRIDNYAELATAAVWIAHNPRDSVAPFAAANKASLRIEEETGIEFLRTTPMELLDTDYLDRRYVFTSIPNGDHDAWTELYTRAEFYKWLLRQRRESSGDESDM